MAMLSIITPSFNRAGLIPQAIDSVLQQDYSNFEHIIIDGASTDGTLERLHRYEHLRVISEPDRGVYDALNKGITAAKGDVIGFLNSDDYYEPNVFGAVIKAFESDAAIVGVCGAARVFRIDAEGHERTVRVHRDRRTKALHLDTITRGVPIINARFFDRAVFDRVGGFDLHFQVASDRDFLLRTWMEGVRFVPLKELVYHYRLHEGSLSIRDTVRDTVVDENLAVCDKYLADSTTPPSVSREVTKWRAQQIGRATVSAIRAGDLAGGTRRLRQGWQLDRLWLLRFIGGGLARRTRALMQEDE